MRHWATPGLAMLAGISSHWYTWRGGGHSLKEVEKTATAVLSRTEGGEEDSESAETLSAQNGGRWVS